MIGVYNLWNRLRTLTKTGTSGYFTADEFNSNLYAVQYAILSLLCDNYENNQKVSDALINHVTDFSGTTLTGGVISNDTLIEDYPDYYRTLAVYFVSDSGETACRKIGINEVGMYESSPIRKANKEAGIIQYVFMRGSIFFLPRIAGIDYTVVYCKKPTEAKIVFTTAEDEDNDYLVVDEDETVDIDFPEGLFNLFVYYMLESMGIEQKESLMQEYSQLGINRTTITDLK